MAAVEIHGLHKRYGDVHAVDGVELSVRDGEFLVLLGSSGSGKTTLLRMIAGLEHPTRGEILIGGERAGPNVPPRARGIAMVFQSYALYPHRTVRENIAFPLRVQHTQRAQKSACSGRRTCSTSPAISTATRGSSRAASASAWHCAVRSCANRAYSCSTSRSRTWTRSCGTMPGTSCYLSTHQLGPALVYPTLVPAVAFVLGFMLMPETRRISIWREEEALAG